MYTLSTFPSFVCTMYVQRMYSLCIIWYWHVHTIYSIANYYAIWRTTFQVCELSYENALYFRVQVYISDSYWKVDTVEKCPSYSIIICYTLSWHIHAKTLYVLWCQLPCAKNSIMILDLYILIQCMSYVCAVLWQVSPCIYTVHTQDIPCTY